MMHVQGGAGFDVQRLWIQYMFTEERVFFPETRTGIVSG